MGRQTGIWAGGQAHGGAVGHGQIGIQVGIQVGRQASFEPAEGRLQKLVTKIEKTKNNIKRRK